MDRRQTRSQALATIAALLGVIYPVLSRAAIAPGTTFSGTLDQELDTKHTQVGHKFKLTNLNSNAYEINGATAYGHVSEVISGGAGRKAQIKLAIDKINTRAGNIYKVSGHVSDVKANTKSNAGREAGAGAAGALVGGLIGGAWGAVLGGGSGFLISKNVHQNITVPQGSLVTFTVDTVRRQSQ